MTAPSYKEFEDLLKIIYKRRAGKNIPLIKAFSNKVIRVIIEIAYNILKGSVVIKDKHLTKLKKDKKNIKSLIRKGVSYKNKRKIIENNPQLLKNMLNVIFD